jgi:hypothetical protein
MDTRKKENDHHRHAFFYETTTYNNNNHHHSTASLFTPRTRGRGTNHQHHPPVSLFRSMRRTNRSAELFAYTDAVHVFPPTFLNRYRIRYNELNKEFRSETRHYDEYRDLQLLEEEESQQYQNSYSSFHSEHDHNPGNDEYHPMGIEYPHHMTTTTTLPHHHRHVVTTATTQSSLFTKIGNTIVLQLPRDQVRLLMDPDLQPGILSVEQWRIPTTTSSCTENHTSKSNNNNNARFLHGTSLERPLLEESANTDKEEENHWPPLRYVLTVDEDLYRKMVDEMSGSTFFPPHEEEKVDIRVACIILGIILLILFINTMAFEEK